VPHMAGSHTICGVYFKRKKQHMVLMRAVPQQGGSARASARVAARALDFVLDSGPARRDT